MARTLVVMALPGSLELWMALVEERISETADHSANRQDRHDHQNDAASYLRLGIENEFMRGVPVRVVVRTELPESLQDNESRKGQ